MPFFDESKPIYCTCVVTSHEPFEATYYSDEEIGDVFGRLENPLNVKPLKRNPGACDDHSLVIKEIPYQVGSSINHLIDLATAPIVFLIRDPRLNISSRMKKKIEVGDSPIFPLIETGWTLLASQIEYCQSAEIPHLIVDSTDFRNQPGPVFETLFNQLQLSYSEAMLAWKPHPSIDIDNLEGDHTHLYRQVLQSKGLIPDKTPIPPIESFPKAGGFRDHLAKCLEIYGALRSNDALIYPDA